ncbi:DNA-binding SARP family transcriptional activator [Kibdelosporangium banguiense]|uniref:DNA-binding SARP family transcriptional activator n=1 Tax=Kibdelosporangium banguiense TaxID=1365924 RepID=A0ABS4TPK5_9PSEU|nr:BTAD domain-containing putative transcriptional regulator [Kibdelosporangium banguiense]MBP2326335.1 DNA-binding SARP family transcriptional activator [Kibdelosporangium banguiense]
MGEYRGGLNYWQRTSDDWQVRLVGAVAVHGADGIWEAPDVGSRKARTLLALLGASHGRMVTVETVVDELWGSAPPQQPRANVATLVSRLRSRFGSTVIVGGRRGYRLGETIRVDLHDAADLVTQAEAALTHNRPAAGLAAAGQGLDLISGGLVLADYPTAEWAERARAMQTGLLRRGRHAGAECALRAGAPARAQALAEAAIAVDALDERAHGMLMRAHADSGEPARALIAYERLRATLAAELGTGPVAATRDLHMAILRANAISA